MAPVLWHALRPVRDRLAALKVLLSSVVNDPDRLARFSREAQVLASLNHANIAHLYGLEHAGEARVLIEDVLSDSSDETSERAISRGLPVWRRSRPWALLGAACAALLLVLALWAPWRAATPSTPVRLTAALGVDASLITAASGAAAILSPDGTALAFVASRKVAGAQPANSQLYLRRLDQLTAAPLSGTDDATSPLFSPDGQWLAFFAGGKLKKIAITGCAARAWSANRCVGLRMGARHAVQTDHRWRGRPTAGMDSRQPPDCLFVEPRRR